MYDIRGKIRYNMRLFYCLLFAIGVFGQLQAQEPCSQSYGAAGSYGIPIDNGAIAAVDIDVEAVTAFTVEEIEVSLHTTMMPLAYSFTAYFYNEELGDLIGTQELNADFPTSTTPGIWKIKLLIPEPVELSGEAEGKKYWVGLSADSDITSEPISLAGIPHSGGANLPAHYSPDGGQTWTSSIPGISEDVEGAVKVSGTCEDIELPPGDCAQTVPSNNFESASSMSGTRSRAVDIVLEPSQDFLLKEMDFNVFTVSGTDITSVNVYYYENDNGLPGELISSQLNVTPSESVFIGTSGPNDVRTITLELDPFLFEGEFGYDTHYWVRLNATNTNETGVWWETTSATTIGYNMAAYFNDSWSIVPGQEGVYEFRGECFDNSLPSDCDSTFADSGGTSGNYGNNENQLWHLIPEAGQMVSVEFLSFATEEGFDGLMIYDGPDTNSPIISSGFTNGNQTCPNGAWTGSGAYSAEGRTFISSHPSGILTFVFTSDEQNTDEGWEALVTCVPPGSAGNCLPGKLDTTIHQTSTGLGAHMFDVTSLSDEDLEIRKFDIHMTRGRKTIKVYYKAGSYEGFEDDPGAWTLLGSQYTIGMGAGNKTELKIGGLVIPPGETYGLYIFIEDYILGEGVTFPINDTPQTYSNDKMVIEPGIVKLGGYFGETSILDRNWQGTIYFCEGGEDPVYEEPCLTAIYGQYPMEVYQPGCYGYPETITHKGWRGEYSMVSVTSGKTYTFSSSSSTDKITIGDSLGVVELTSGIGSVEWTPDFDGEIRFYTTLEDCEHENSNPISRYVMCGEEYTPEEPDFDCFFGDGLESNRAEFGSPIQYGDSARTADDFIVEQSYFDARQIRLNVISDSPITEGRFNFHYHDDVEQGPEVYPFLTTDMMEPTQQLEIGVAYPRSSKIYELTFDLPETISFNQGIYWLVPEINGTDTFWELTYTGSHGGFTWVGEETYWIEQPDTQAVFFISGDCETIGIAGPEKQQITVYPNPASDILNIRSDKKLETIEGFTITGAKVFSASAPDSQINIQSLAAGTYIFKISSEEGYTEYFKVIKK